MDGLKGLGIIGIAIWLMFLGGCEAIGRMTHQSMQTGQPAVASTMQQGAERFAATAQAAVAASGVTTVTKTLQVPLTNVSSLGSRLPGGTRIVPATMPALPTATPVPAPKLPPCSTVTDSVTPCEGPPAPAQAPPVSAEESMAVWEEMYDICEVSDCSPAPNVPVAELPTECQNPPNRRAEISCDLIRRGVIHPKG